MVPTLWKAVRRAILFGLGLAALAGSFYAGYRVGYLEAAAWYDKEDFAATPTND
jgi:hypothetical protein